MLNPYFFSFKFMLKTTLSAKLNLSNLIGVVSFAILTTILSKLESITDFLAHIHIRKMVPLRENIVK